MNQNYLQHCIYYLKSKLICFIFIYVALAFRIENVASNCLVDVCTDQQAQKIEELVILPKKTVEYCEILNEYISCLNATARSCHSMLDFHSAQTAANQRWKQFQCHTLIRFRHTPKKLCPMWSINKDNTNTSSYKHLSSVCSIFGKSMLLRQFNDKVFERCTFKGTRPFIDNQFFIIQLSTTSDFNKLNLLDFDFTKTNFLTENLQKISKVTVLIKSYSTCINQQKLYEASIADDYSQTKSLPSAFVDGTNKVIINDEFETKTVLEIVEINNFLIEIKINYIDTIIQIHCENGFFSVFVKVPQHLHHSEFKGMIQNQLCLTNTHQNIKKNGICNYELANEFAPILSNITLYQNCILSYYQNKSGHFNKIQKQNSIEKCKSAKLYNKYFDVCVFDLIHLNKKDIAQQNSIINSIRNAWNFELEFNEQKEKFIDLKNSEILQKKKPLNFNELNFANKRQSLQIYEQPLLQNILEKKCEAIKRLINKPSSTISPRIFKFTVKLINTILIFSVIFKFTI